MKTFFKNTGKVIVEKLHRHPIICNLVLSVVLAFLLEVLGRQTFDLSAVGFVKNGPRCSFTAFLLYF